MHRALRILDEALRRNVFKPAARCCIIIHMPYDNNNVFAKILREEIPCQKIAENRHALAFYDINPQAAQHALVVPKGAYRSFTEFAENATAEEITDWTRLIGETARRLGVAADGYRLIANNGDNARQEVPHLHVHVVGGEKLGAMLPQP